MAYQPRIFGITSSLSGITQGVIANNISYNDTVEIAEARGISGEVIDLAAYSKGTEVTLDGLYTGTGIEVGSVITIGDKNYLVSQTTKTEANQDFQQQSVTARTSDQATLWPLSGFQQGQ